MTEVETKNLVIKSIEAKKNAYAVYSNYPVGAALLTASGEIFTGCNIENVAFSPTVCAERTAFFKAVSEGFKDFKAIAVSAGQDDSDFYPSPCGVCRQVMREFCNPASFTVILVKNKNDYKTVSLEELLPNGFGPEFLN